MAPDDIDDLFTPKTGGAGKSWYELITDDDEREFVDLVTARAVKYGRLPNVAGMRRVLEERFGDTVTADPIRRHLRRAMKEAAAND